MVASRRRILVSALFLVAAGVTLGYLGCRSPESEPPADAPDVAAAESRGDDLFRMNGGFWIRRRDAPASDKSEGPEADALHALPYVTGSEPVPARRGVTVYDSSRAASGSNLYTSAHGPEAFLVDMRGRPLHRWMLDREDVWPGLRDDEGETDLARRYFRRVRLLEDRELLAIYEYSGIVRVDADSRLVWAHRGGAHHDLDVDERGNVYVLGSEERISSLRESPILDDNVTIFDGDGTVLDTIWISECLARSDYSALLRMVRTMRRRDVLHTNTLEILDGTQEHRSAALAKGNLLISMRTLGTIAVLDPEERRIVWASWGPWRMQHQPVLLASGRMLLFDNRPAPPDLPIERRSSRVIELDPFTREIVWEYAGTLEAPFYSSLCGSNQRLPNGNTLITESDYGRAFEVTPDGEIVWEFLNPHTAGPKGEFVALIPELIRLGP